MPNFIVNDNLIVDQISSTKEYSPWVIDLKTNNLTLDPQALKRKFIGEEINYGGSVFKVTDVEFFRIVKEKIVLICQEL